MIFFIHGVTLLLVPFNKTKILGVIKRTIVQLFQGNKLNITLRILKKIYITGLSDVTTHDGMISMMLDMETCILLSIDNN